MKKIFKKLGIMFTALLSLSLGTVPNNVNEVRAASNTYVKVTEALDDWTGEYLIVYEDGSLIFNGSLTSSLDSASNKINVTINDGQIITNSDYSFAIEKTGTSYTIKSSGGYYMGQTSDANGLKSSDSTTYNNTLSLDSDGNINIVSGGAYLRYNAASGQYRFRYYKSSSYTGQKAIQLYKLDENNINPELGDVTELSYSNKILSWNAVENAEYYNITIKNKTTNETKTYNQHTNTSLELSCLDYVDGDTYIAEVTAVAQNYKASSAECEFTFDYTPKEKISVLETMVQLDFKYTKSVNSGTASVTATSDATSTTLDEGENSASKLNLDSNIFNVNAIKNNANNNVGSYSNIRLYGNANGGNQLSINLIDSNAKIISVILNISSGYNNSMKVESFDEDNYSELTSTNSTYLVNANGFRITNTETSNTQVRIDSIIINYEGESVTYTNFKNVNLRYSATIPSEIVSNVDFAKSFGVNITIGDNTADYLIDDTYVVNGATSFALVISDIPSTDYSTVINATAFVTLTDGTKVNLKSKSYSVKSMITYYLTEKTNELNEEQKLALNAFNSTLTA